MMEQAQGISSKITRDLLISVMIVIFMFFLLLFFFYLTMRYRFSSPAARSANIRFVPVADEGLRGLDPALLQSLPITVFRHEDFKEGLECSVCLSELSPGEEARFLPKCGHGFHLHCIDMWFRSNYTCPLCRGPVVSGPTTQSGCEQSLGVTEVATGQILESNPPTGDATTTTATTTTNVAAGPSAQKSERILVVEIPNHEMDGLSSTPVAEDTKSPMSVRLRSLRRFLSRRSLGIVSPPSAGGGRDIEEGIVGGGGAAAEGISCSLIPR